MLSARQYSVTLHCDNLAVLLITLCVESVCARCSGKESMELSALAMLNPLGSEIVPLTPLQLMPFKLQAKSAPMVLSQVCSSRSPTYLCGAHIQCWQVRYKIQSMYLSRGISDLYSVHTFTIHLSNKC